MGEKLHGLDEKDLAIVEELKKDSSLSEKKLARLTRIPMTTVHNRLKKLKASGAIEQFTVKLNYEKLGRPMVAFVRFKIIGQADHQKVFDEVKSFPGIHEVAMITGEFDIMFKARVSGMEELNQLVTHNLRGKKYVGESRTILCYQVWESP